jgi:hypothetical protein
MMIAAGWLGSGAVAACGGQAKSADSPRVCPDGTVLQGSECVAAEAPNSAPAAAEAAQAAQAPPPSAADHPAADSTGVAAGKTPYDRDAVEAELKRGARQVKANCGAATDDEGKAAGPWGKTKASIVLGRNGHVRQVTVPEPFSGKPVGVCIVHSFDKIQFPPYASSGDVTVDWDVDVVEPKH